MSPDLLVWDMKTLGWLYSSLIHENFIKKVMCYSLLLDISKRDMLSTGFTSSKLNQYPIFMDYAVYNFLIFFSISLLYCKSVQEFIIISKNLYKKESLSLLSIKKINEFQHNPTNNNSNQFALAHTNRFFSN